MNARSPREQLAERPPPEAVAAAFIASESLLQPGDVVLAALSGGPDSTALALILQSLGYRVVLAHVDHRLRLESAADAEHCRAVATSLGLPIEVARLDVPPAGEAAARTARYAALEELRRRAGATVIATGHTLDDDAETVLLRQARGGFPLGIPPRRGCIVRPLLALRRSATAAYCAARGVPVLTDPSNADESFARNRVRRRVLPGLGDAGVEALGDLAAESRRQAALRHAEVDLLLAALARRPEAGEFRPPSGVGELRLDRTGLAALAADLQRAVLRRALAEVGIDPSPRLLDDLCFRLIAGPGGPIDLPAGAVAHSGARDLVVSLRPSPAPLPPSPLVVPGRTLLPAWGLEATVRVLAIPPGGWPVLAGRATQAPPPGGGWSALFDSAALGAGQLVVRPRRPGDRYRPLGAPGERKLQDVFVDAKVPRAERDRVPILTCGGQVAWVAGFRIGDRHRLTPASTAAVEVTLAPTPPDSRP